MEQVIYGTHTQFRDKFGWMYQEIQYVTKLGSLTLVVTMTERRRTCDQRRRMMKDRERVFGLEGVTQADPQSPLWQHTCPFRQSADLEHFSFWQITD
jgi:hypothetical protein